jgi:hypothetical protein
MTAMSGRRSFVLRFSKANHGSTDDLRLARGSLARATMASLVAAPALLCAGCLITSEPSFDDALATPPMFVPAGISPDPRLPIKVLSGAVGDRVILGGSIKSEDNGHEVRLLPVIDYGLKQDVSENPWLDEKNSSSLAPGTLDVQRPFPDIDVTSFLLGLRPGACYSLTLFAAHAYGDGTTDCPYPFWDSDQLVWIVRRCDSDVDCATIDIDTCGTTPPPGLQGNFVQLKCPGDVPPKAQK